eukprot:12475.XXX_772061_772971_1 [CDS] Oithona nana genome sequencing.
MRILSKLQLIIFYIFVTFCLCSVLDRDYQLESKLHDLEYDIEVLDYGESLDYSLARDEIELTLEKLEENILTNEFGISPKIGQQRLSCATMPSFMKMEGQPLWVLQIEFKGL